MNEDIINIIEKYIILLLGVVDRPVPSIWHVEKELFILSKSNPKIQQFFEFEKHYNGPYSQVLKEVVEEPLYYEGAFALNENGLYLTTSGKRIFEHVRRTGQGLLFLALFLKKNRWKQSVDGI